MGEVGEVEREGGLEGSGVGMSHEAIGQALNAWAGYLGFRLTEITDFLDQMPYKTVGIFSGNQAGKTSSVAYHYVQRLMGIHKNSEKNRLCKKIRCMSSSLPENDSPEEQDNTQYLELKKLIPPNMIEKDITARGKNLVVRRPEGLSSPRTVFEFRSSKQEMQDLGKIQLSSVWHDEETPKGHREECKMRLLAESGDEVFSLTPTNALCFDEDTELLTDRGWQFYDGININDLILTYNMDSDVMEWKRMDAFHIYKYQGEMVSMKNGSFDFLVTPNHKWVVCNDRRKNDLYLEEAQNLNTKHIIKRISDKVSVSNNPIYSNPFVKLIGWIVSDGTVNKNRVVVYQSSTAYPEHCRNIDGILSAIDLNKNDWAVEDRDYGVTIIDGKEWKGHGVMRRWRLRGELRRRVLSVLNGKAIKQEFICSLGHKQLESLFDAITDGDGHRTEHGGVRLNQTNNDDLIDNFQLISTLLGRLSHQKKWVNINHKTINGINVYSNSERFWPNTHVKSLEIKKVGYDGFVWCPTTENGTVVVRRNGCVSISGNSYTFDEIWNRAAYIARTSKIAEKFGLPLQEWPNPGTGIGCLQMATDDNPTLDPDTIERLFEDITDPDELAIRRYGVFKQISGRIHKSYDPSVCYISGGKWFPDGVPYGWLHSRGIDYHESRTPWSIGWVSASPEDEWFLWQEFHPAIDGANAYNTYDIAKAILRKSGDYYYNLNLIDPLANKKQANTLFSTTDDLNRYFDEIHRDSGIGTSGYWTGWDTKGVGGRDEVGKRFKNAVRCGRPFNNLVKEKGRTRRLPTLWVLDCCPKFNKSLINWRFGEYVTGQTKAVNDPKPTPQQKWSHDCMVLECLAKDHRLLHAADLINNPPRQVIRKNRSLTGR